MKLDKTTLEATRKKCAEALKVWKAAVKRTQDASAGTIKPGTGIEPEQFISSVREAQTKAKADYEPLANDLAAHDTAVREEAEIKAAENALAAPVGDGPLPPTGPGETHKSILAEKAERFELALGANPSVEDLNQVAFLKAESAVYGRINLDKKQRGIYREYFMALMTSGDPNIDPKVSDLKDKLYAAVPSEKLAQLITGNAGNLAPEEFVNEVLRDLAGFSNFRRLARVVRTGKDKITWPTVKSASNARADQGYTSGFLGSFKKTRSTTGGGLALSTQDQPDWGRLNIHVHRWEPDAIEMDLETMEDPDVDAEGIMAAVIAEVKGTDEEFEFTSGDGVGRPFGVLEDQVRTVQSGSAGGLGYGNGTTGFLGLYAALRGQWRQNATWMLNSQSFSAALGLEDTGNTLIFPPNALPNTLFGRPVAFNEFMEDPDTDGNDAVLFGDFKHYIIVDRMQLRIIRLMERAAPNIALLPIARLGGQVSRLEAFKKMVVGA